MATFMTLWLSELRKNIQKQEKETVDKVQHEENLNRAVVFQFYQTENLYLSTLQTPG